MTGRSRKGQATKLPIIAVVVYMLGLFLLVMERRFLGFTCVTAGIITGIYAAYRAWQSGYKPSRRPDPRWARFVESAKKALSRERS